MDLWPVKENYPFGDYFVFVRFSPPPQSPDKAQFQVMLQNKALPKDAAKTVDSVAREYAAKMRADGVAAGPIDVTKLTVGGREGRRVRYRVAGPGGSPVVLAYNFLVVERRIFAVVCAAFPDELPKYQPVFDKMLKSLKIDPQALVKAFPLPE